MGCACKGIKMAVIGALVVINDQGWLWGRASWWLLVGIVLVILGLMKVIWPCCPIHGCCKDKSAMVKAKKGK